MQAVGDLNMPANLKFVLLKFADHADDHGRDTWPSYDRVARYCSTSTKTVQRAVGRLRKDGILVEQDAGPVGGRGKSGRGVVYTIDLEVARSAYGYWNERRDGTVELVAPATKTPDNLTGVSDPETPDRSQETPDTDDRNPGQVTQENRTETKGLEPEPSLNRPEPGARAPAREDRAAPAAEEEPPACQAWNEKRAELEVAVGRKAWSAWLSWATPMHDDGDHLTLAVPPGIFAQVIEGQHGAIICAVLGRQGLRCVPTPWADPAARKRREKEGA